MAVRQRKGNEISSAAKKSILTSTKKKNKENGSNTFNSFRFAIIFGSLLAAVLGGYAWSYIKTARAFTPLAVPKAVELLRDQDDDLKRLWGTYRYLLICLKKLHTNYFYNCQYFIILIPFILTNKRICPKHILNFFQPFQTISENANLEILTISFPFYTFLQYLKNLKSLIILYLYNFIILS